MRSVYRDLKWITSDSSQNSLANQVVIGTHHKTGTVWLKKIFRMISSKYGLYLYSGEQQDIPDQCHIFFQSHSRIDFGQLDDDYRGVHMIRDPRDRIISGCFYHQKSHEPWLHQPHEEFGGLTYQQKINSFSSFEEKLIFEMENAGTNGTQEMLSWDYENPQILEIKYEDLVVDEELFLFHKMFNFLGFHGSVIPDLLQIAHDNSLFSGKIKNSIHVRSGATSQWPEYFNLEIRERFEKQFPGALVRLGYESDDSWVSPG